MPGTRIKGDDGTMHVSQQGNAQRLGGGPNGRLQITLFLVLHAD